MTIKRKSKTITFEKFYNKATEIYGTCRITKDQAKEVGLMFYHSENICNKGHSPCFRYVSTNACRNCKIEDSFKNNNPELSKEIDSAKENRSKLVNKLRDLEIKRLEKDIYSYDF